MEEKAHVVEEVVKYSDGTETVISYRGVVEDGEVILDTPETDVPVEEKPLVVEPAPETLVEVETPTEPEEEESEQA
jgi:hypothetical protein